MRTSTVVMIGILGLAGTPLALHLAGGSSTGTATSWIKKLHGGSAGPGHGTPTGAPGSAGSTGSTGSVGSESQDKKPAPKTAATLAGKWTVTVDSDQGSFVSTMVLKHEGRNITGTFSNPHGEGTMPVVGELVDGVLALSVDATADHGEMHLAFKGTVKDDGTLAGKMTSAMGESKWTAIRTTGSQGAARQRR